MTHITAFLTHTKIWLPKLSFILIILVLSWIAIKVATRCIAKLSKHHTHDRTMLCLLATRVSNISIMLISLICILGTLGVNVSALVASLGLAGFTLGFALKDILSNVCAGFMLLLYRPFTLGDVLTISSKTGTVTDINLRYTTLLSDEKIMLIPNNTALTSVVQIKRKQ